MKKDRMLELAEFITKVPHKNFNMSTWFNPEEPDKTYCEAEAIESCGTSACLAGWAVLHAGKCLNEDGWVKTAANRFIKSKGLKVHAQDFAKKYLGLTEAQANMLFHAPKWPVQFQHGTKFGPRTPEQAAEVIRWMVEQEGA